MNTYLEGKVEALPGEDRHIDWGMLNRSHPASHREESGDKAYWGGEMNY